LIGRSTRFSEGFFSNKSDEKRNKTKQNKKKTERNVQKKAKNKNKTKNKKQTNKNKDIIAMLSSFVFFFRFATKPFLNK